MVAGAETVHLLTGTGLFAKSASLVGEVAKTEAICDEKIGAFLLLFDDKTISDSRRHFTTW